MASQVRSSSQLDPLKTDNNNAVSTQSPSQPLRHQPKTPPFDYPGARAAGKGDWRPTQGGGRHNSPLYGRHRKRPSSSSIGSNESEIATTTLHPKSEPAPVSSSSSLDGTIATGLSVQPLQTLHRSRSMHNEWEQSAAQQMRMELSSSRAGLGFRANSSVDVFTSTSPLAYDEKENGPRSCPSTFNDANWHKVSPSKRRQPRGGELIVSKLQPTRNNVNNMLTYVHELQMSEASLRKELVKTKLHTAEELNQSLSKLNELQRTMQEVERDRKRSRRRLEKKEQRIRELAAKLERAEATQDKARPGRRNVFAIDGLPRIAEEDTSHIETDPRSIEQHIPLQEAKRLEPSSETPPALTVEAVMPPSRQNQLSRSILHPIETSKEESTEFAVSSPPSPNRPLWDPWVSGGAAPMKDLPPIFTIGSTGLDPEVTPVEDVGTTMVGNYELKSILLSPRHGQERLDDSSNVCSTQAEKEQQQEYASPALPLDQQVFATLDSSQDIRNDSISPPPPYLQQNSSPPEKQVAAHELMLEDMASMELSSQSDAMRHVGAMSPIRVSPHEQQNINTDSHDSEVHVWNGCPDQQKVQMSAARIATGNEDPSLTLVIGHPTDLPLQLPVQASPSVPDTQVKDTDPPERFSSQPFLTSKAQPNRVASASRDTIEAAPTEPVSLETLLIDFFTEVDNKRLKMAKVYGKRYAGREKWLFAELSKRYGAAKVAALKARFDNGSGSDASAVTNHGGGSNDPHAKNSSDVSTHAKARRQGHPRHPQFAHPPTPTSNVDLSAGAPSLASPVAPFQVKGESRSQTRQVVEEVSTSSSPSKQTPANPISPQKRPTGGNTPSLSGPPPSFPNLQETGEEDNATAVGTDGPAFRSGPARMTRHGVPTGQFNQPHSQPQTEMLNSNTAPLGLRQRHELSARSQTNTGAERPAVTLEGLLKELYKKHQPDKLKNVSIVAKEYAGRERELVRLLKGKYGALSVKRLEKKLDALERVHRARMGDKGARKKRGCFVRTISLVLWLSVLLYFSFGAVFVSFVVLDAWGCRSIDSEEQELEAAGDCLPLKKELETFTYERIATYVGQSHSDACFCSEWKARERALFDTFSCEDLVKLVRLVPFSPASFGAPWIAIVKEQVLSQKFYDSYAKPVVVLSLDAGSFVWTSVLELAGYAEVPEVSPVVENAVDNYSDEVPSLGDDGASDTHTGLFQQSAAVDNKSLADNDNADVLLMEEAEAVEDEAVAVAPGLLEQVPVEEELDTFDEMLKTDDPATSDRATNDVTDNVLVEDEDVISVSEGMTTANEEGVSLLSETDGEEPIESIDVLELKDVAPVEAAESIDAGEQELTNEAKVEKTWNDASIPAEQAESVGDADDEAFAFTETEEGGVAVEKTSLNDFEEVAEAAVEVNEEVSAEDGVAVSEGVVEVEGRQEDLDLSYSETETDEALSTKSAEVSILLVDKELELLLGGDEEPSALSEETEVVAAEDASEDGFVGAAEEDSAPVMRVVDQDFAAPTSSAIDADEEMMKLESDIATASEVFETETENVEKEPTDSEVLQKDPSHTLSPEFGVVIGESDSPNFTNIEELALNLADEEIAASLLSEGPESEAGKELDDTTEAEAQETEMTSDEEEEVPPERDDANVLAEEEFIVAKSELEPSFSSSDSVAEVILAEEGSVRSSDDGYWAIKRKNDDGHEETVGPAEMEEPILDDGDDANMLEKKSEEADDELVIPAEVEVGSELEVEEYVGSVPSEEMEVPELTEDLENQDYDLKGSVEEASAVSAEIEAAGEGSILLSEVEVETLEEAVNELDEVGSRNAEMTTPSETEVMQSVSEVDLVNELDKEPVASFEATVGSDDEDTVSVAEEVDEYFEDASTSEGVKDLVADEDEVLVNDTDANASAISADEGPNHNDDDDDDENEEIAFMLGLENPEELLRLAEQAAAATMETTETR